MILILLNWSRWILEGFRFTRKRDGYLRVVFPAISWDIRQTYVDSTYPCQSCSRLYSTAWRIDSTLHAVDFTRTRLLFAPRDQTEAIMICIIDTVEIAYAPTPRLLFPSGTTACFSFPVTLFSSSNLVSLSFLVISREKSHHPRKKFQC